MTTETPNAPVTSEPAADEQQEPRQTSAAMFYNIIVHETAADLSRLEALFEANSLAPSVQADVLDHIAAVKARAVHTATLCQSAIELANAQIMALSTCVASKPAETDSVSAISRLRDAMRSGR